MAKVNRRPMITDSATMTLIKDLKDAIDKLSQQRIVDKNDYDKRLSDLQTHHELQQNEDCQCNQAFSKHTHTERQCLKEQLEQQNKITLVLQKKVDDKKWQESE